MLQMTLILEDNLVVASRDLENWRCEITDMTTGTREFVHLDDEQMGAVMGLAFGGDDTKYAEELYKIAGPIFSSENFARECRIIP